MDVFCIALAGVVLLIWLRMRFASFVAQRPADYADMGGPAFDLPAYLNGPMLCEGVIYGPFGRVTSRFDARFDCNWDGAQGTMAEHFRYSDGSTQDRMWHLELKHDGQLTMMADDVIGAGVGRPSGPTVQMRYRLRLPPSAGGHIVNVQDWMYLTADGMIINRSQFRKFGIKVAELIATIRPAT